MSGPKSILIITPFFCPSTGGAETYAKELCEYLRTHNYYVYVLTFQPLTDSKIKGEKLEKIENMEIRRYQWVGHNLFHKLEAYPFLEFLYITPYLLIRSLWWMLWNHQKIDIIDAQGLNSAFIARILKKIFRKRTVASVMSLYDFVPNSRLAKKVNWILRGMDHIIVESEVSKKEIESIGISSDKITPYVEWVNLEKFKPGNKEELKESLGLPKTFIILFVARAIKIKGADLLLNVAERMKSEDVSFVFISRDGPMVKVLKEASKRVRNVIFIEGVDYKKLPDYYAAADIFVIPSRYSENAARTIVEAVACGTPVIGSNMGAIPSLLDKSVGIVVKPEVEDIERALKRLLNSRDILKNLTDHCRRYAEKKFSVNNAQTISDVYNYVFRPYAN